MRSAVARITLKIIELLGCIACFLAKIITDLEARRVFLRNQKLSREWGLLHNITWSSAGNSFANVTYGGFTLITALMLISRCIDAKSRPSLTEKIFLIVGMLCFFAMGGLVLAAFDQVPSELHDNSLILGCMSFFVAFIMLFDLSDPMARHVTDTTQTETRYLTPPSELQTPVPIPTTPATDTSTAIVHTSADVADSNAATTRNGQLHVNIPQARNEPNGRSVTDRQTTPLSSPEVVDITKNGNYHRGDSIDLVHTQNLPIAEQPVFERVLMPEKKRPTFQKVPEPSNSVAHTVYTGSHYPSSQQNNAVMHMPTDMNEHDYYSRHQMPQHRQRQSQHQQQHHVDRQRHLYKPYHNYGYEEYDEHSDNPPPRYVLKSNALTAINRYREDAANIGEPMMVIRNYSQPMHVSTAASSRPNNQSMHETIRSDAMRTMGPQKSMSPPSNRGYAAGPKNKGPGVYKQHSTKRTHCNGNGDDCGSDDEVDFRKMNSAIRPGFVANAAKMWDQRAAEQTNEFNTIV